MRILALGLFMSSAVLAGPTFTRDVAPILYRNCVSCHRAGEMAPMSLLEYKSVRPWAKAIREAVIATAIAWVEPIAASTSDADCSIAS